MDKIVKVDNILKSYENYASTEPLLVLLSNNVEAVIKYPYNNSGNLCLINEYICYRIAALLELPIPDFGICFMDDSVKNSTDFQLYTDNYGPCFYSHFLTKSTPLSSSNAIRIRNKDDFTDVILFDHIIYNKDRHMGNILITPQDKMYIIDHSHVFKNQSIWDKYTFIQGMNNQDYNDRDILKENKPVYDCFFSSTEINKEQFDRFCDKIKTRVTEKNINNIISDVPKEWIDTFDDENMEKLNEYLNYRVAHIGEIIELIIKERGI